MNDTKITAAERELRSRQSDLAQYEAVLEEAKDVEQVQEAAGKVAAAKVLVERAERNLAKAKAGATEGEKQARRDANVAALATIKKAHTVATKAGVAKVAKALALLVEGATEIQGAGQVAKDALREVLRQTPERDRRGHFAMVDAVGNLDTALGSILEGAMQRAGIFTSLLPNPGVQLRRFDEAADIEAAAAARTDRLVRRVEHAVAKINEAIQ